TSWFLEKRSRVGFVSLDFDEACSAGLGVGVLFRHKSIGPGQDVPWKTVEVKKNGISVYFGLATARD
ncbi:MAG: hypothetical protein ABGZ08_07715, partial [Akkermansiaceae bacterium]